MDNLIYMLFVSIFVPILLMAGLVEKKARQPIVFVLIGIFVSVFASEVNGLMVALLPMSTFEITIIVTPITEEILKAIPILLFAVVLSAKKEALFTASMAVGIGFCSDSAYGVTCGEKSASADCLCSHWYICFCVCRRG